jgi:hypothetical protein
MHGKEDRYAMTISLSAARRLVSGLTVVAVMIAMELGSVTLTGHVRGSGTSIHEPHSAPLPPKQGIAPLENSRVHVVVGVLSPPAFDPKHRLGFLEFENDPE